MTYHSFFNIIQHNMLPIKECPVCQGGEFKKLFEDFDRNLKVDFKKFTLVKCRNCGLGFINPQPEPEELSRYYSKEYQAAGNSDLFEHGPLSLVLSKAKNSFLKIFRVQPSKNVSYPHFEQGKFLDFGCGTGRLINRYKISYPNYDFFGVDISERACDEASKFNNVNIFCGTLKQAKYKDNFFDIISAYHVLEHVPNPKKTLVELNRILKPGGKIFISLPNFNSFERFVFGKYWKWIEIPRHLFHFNRKNLGLLLGDNSFKVESVVYPDTSLKIVQGLFYRDGRKKINPLVFKFVKYFLSFPLRKLHFVGNMSFKATKIKNV